MTVSSATAQAAASGSDSSSDPLVDQGGRLLGPRALKTRKRILEATVVLLEEKPMRDLRVIDIARRIGTSPATFYQYFKDVEDVVLHLATDASAHTPEIVDLIQGNWDGREGFERARKLVSVVMNHWDRYTAILKVRNNRSDEGDLAFREIRMRAMLPMVEAFEREITKANLESGDQPGSSPQSSDGAGEWRRGPVHAGAAAMALTSMLERLSMYHVNIEQMGLDHQSIIDTNATIIQSLLSSRR